MQIKQCLICSKQFKFRAAPSDIKTGGGKYCSIKCRNSNMSFVLKEKGIKPTVRFVANGENHPSWKGNGASYSALHHWLKRILGTPKFCIICGKTKGRFEWANISHNYKRDIDDYMSICYSCHDMYDNARAKMWATIRSRKYEQDIGII